MAPDCLLAQQQCSSATDEETDRRAIGSSVGGRPHAKGARLFDMSVSHPNRWPFATACARAHRREAVRVSALRLPVQQFGKMWVIDGWGWPNGIGSMHIIVEHIFAREHAQLSNYGGITSFLYLM